MKKEDGAAPAGKLENWLGNLKQLFSRTPRDRAAITEMLAGAERNNLLAKDTLTMLNGAMNLSGLRARDVMIPKVRIVSVRQGFRIHKIINIISESGYSRFPVFGSSREEVVGILLAKDLLTFFPDKSGDEKDFNIREAIRPAAFIPESKRLHVLLRELRENKNHMVIVVDEYSHVSGIITIEDILEEIIGDIFDEHDYEDEENIHHHKGNRHTVNALTTIKEFNEYFGAQLGADSYDTVGGLVTHRLGRVPRKGETVAEDEFLFTVLRTDQRKVSLLRVERAIAAKVAAIP